MAILKVDETKCKRDGICVDECPRRIIKQESKDSFPEVAVENEPYCMVCGHCVVVCPHAALSVRGVRLEDCPEIDKTLTISNDQAAQFLRSRRSIRLYRDKPVDRKTMTQLIEAARYAPTASNAQKLHWTVINGRSKLNVLSEKTIAWMRRVISAHPDEPASDYFRPVVARWESGYDGILRSAQSLVVVSAPTENKNGLVDCSIALTYLELAALPLGIGTCWAGFLWLAMGGTPELIRDVGLPEGHAWFYPMMIGYPKVKYHRLPEREKPSISWM